MGSRYPPDFYDDRIVTSLIQAYREVWMTVVANDPFQEWGKHERLRPLISQALMELAAEGISDVDELRTRVIAKVIIPRSLTKSLSRPHRRSQKAA